ncbi:MAG: spondin domain-containing protein [Myxococcota bacterium]
MRNWTPALSGLMFLGSLVAAPALANPPNTTGVYTITFENLTSGQYFTPPNYAVHDRQLDVFRLDQAASPGVQAVAENGDVPALAAELDAAIDAMGLGVSGVGDAANGPIGPGQSVTFEFVSDITSDFVASERRLSMVSMVICTNDGFAGLRDIDLPRRDGETRTYFMDSFDAGTEINTEARGDIVPAPFCGPGGGSGTTDSALAEGGVIRRHQGIQGGADLDPNVYDWQDPAVRVTVTRSSIPRDVTYEVTFENRTTGQYFTPPNWAIHQRGEHIFQLNHAASFGVQAVAENGAVPVLATELETAIDDLDIGASGVGDTGGPVGPGQSATFEIASSETQLSIVSMVICTNDGFAGLDARDLPNQIGQTRTYRLDTFDAGTEINTENRIDIVPAPFCGAGPGSGMSDPALAENGVIRRHRGIEGFGDLDPFVYDWRDPAVFVTVKRLD